MQLLGIPALWWLTAAAPAGVTLPALEVEIRALDTAQAGATALDASRIARRAPRHPQELFSDVPGVWISRGSGQEHLTAIRSPVLTGPGACGAFLILEDHIPIRPAGFCNVNELFEVNLAQAERIDVLRGPGLASHGANGLHGVIDVASPDPAAAAVAVEAGSQDFIRGAAAYGGGAFGVSASYTDSNSFRLDEGYQQGFANVRYRRSGERLAFTGTLALADLDQQTAGFITGFDAFRDTELRRSNPNPEAFRNAHAARAAGHFEWFDEAGGAWRISPYLRQSEMRFLQHFLPGKPLERNRQTSGGVQAALSGGRLGDGLTLGLDAEAFHGELIEFQAHEVEDGSDFLRAIRPPGLHYDYAIDGAMTALWGRYLWQGGNGLELELGLRGEYLFYDYNNRMLDGNTRDDGTPCAFGGCLFSRPADRHDDFFNLAPAVTLAGPIAVAGRWQLRLARGFRPPQATELYRLQSGQQIADLQSERLDSISLGLARRARSWFYELTGFYQVKRNVILRDAGGFNISDGKTRHLGLEWALGTELGAGFALRSTGTYARHTYRFDRLAGGGEIIRRGNDVDTAPRRLFSAELDWRGAGIDSALRLEHLGDYFLDAANSARYAGHTLLHLEANAEVGRGWHLGFRLRNLFGERFAERADFAFDEFRYFPGEGRTFFATFGWRAGG